MKIPAAALALLAPLLASLCAGARAQPWQPARPVEIVVHNAPGGGSDLIARHVSNLLEKEKLLPVRTLVVNRPGGGGVTAMSFMAEKRGDPHTLAMFTTAWLLTPLLSEEAKTGFYDMTPVARLVLESALIVVKADSPYRSVADFIEAAKKEPGKLRQSGGSPSRAAKRLRCSRQCARSVSRDMPAS